MESAGASGREEGFLAAEGTRVFIILVCYESSSPLVWRANFALVELETRTRYSS